MKILILGAGQVGRTAAHHLSREEANEVTVVDINEDVLRDLQDRLDVRTVAGNAAHPTVLEAAGAAEADIIVALTNSDEVNMMACEVAFTLFRTPTKIARIRAAEYTEPPGAVQRRRAVGGRLHQPRAAGHRIRRAPHPLPRHAAGARLRRRQGAPGGGARARAAGCWSATACASCRSTCPRSRCAWWRSTATAAASRPKATR